MKKFIMLIPAMALTVADVFAMDKSPMGDQNSVSNITRKQKLKRVDSRARLPILKDKYLLPAPMSTEEYIDMLKKFLNENNQLIDPKELIEEANRLFNKIRWNDYIIKRFHPTKDRKTNIETDISTQPIYLPGEDLNEFTHKMNEFLKKLTKQVAQLNTEVHDSLSETENGPQDFAEGTDISLPKGTLICDISCPNMIKYAQLKLSLNSDISEKDPSDLPEDKLLQKEHLKWIINYFRPFVEKIQNHEIDPDDKYDSGLTDEDINLLIKLTVGPNRVFGISNMSEIEKKKFHNEALTVMLQNATGFQRALSLLIMSIINSITQEEIWHIEIDFLKGEKSSSQFCDKVHINEADDLSLDSSLFHEITHSFHQMLMFYNFRGELISNISIINSRDLNLIDQYFPMLRPHVMNPILREIESLIDEYFGHDFEKVTEEEKQKLTVVVLEPIVRNAMMNGFGNFVFPNYKSGQSLLISTDMLTTKQMAMCAYLSSILDETELYPTYNEKNESITVPTNISDFKKPFLHPLFEKVKVTPTQVTVTSELFETDSTWNTAEEKLTMQGNTVLSINGSLYYIQDRQNEHIYLLRSHDDQTEASPIASHFRYHEGDSNRYIYIDNTLKQMLNCCSSLKIDVPQNVIGYTSSLQKLLDKAFIPSMEEKYGLPGVEPTPYQEANFHKAKKDQEQYETWLSALRNGREKAENKVKKKLEKEFDQKKVDQEVIYQQYLKLIPKTMTEEIQKQIAILLKTKMDINSANEDGETILFEAVRNYPKSVVQLLLNNGADIFIKNNDDKDIMQIAMKRPLDDFEETVDLLLKNGFKANENLIVEVINDYDKPDAKHRKIEYLKKKGVRINARDLDGNTVLHNILIEMTGMFDDNASVKLLVNCGANVNAKNNKKETPLHVSVKNENTSLEIVHTLLKAGAEVNSRTYQGKTALHYLIPQWYDYDGDDAKVRANRFKALIDLLISKGLDINSIDNKGDTSLHTIVREGIGKSKNAINFLIKKGANPIIKNYDGKTPLELAKEKQSPNAQFFEKLINH